MDYLLPSTVYQPLPRPGRGRQLNTIIEDNEETLYGSMSESEGMSSDTTVIGRPAALDMKYFVQPAQQARYTTGPPSVVSDSDDDNASQTSSRNSVADSDAGTVFSDSCPSLTGSQSSDATSYGTNLSRNSSRNSRNRYPALMIPRGSWNLEAHIKEIPFGMSPSTKVRLSPEALERLPQHIPSIDAPPSLADTNSVRSESPCCMHPSNSAPQTPNLHNLELIEGQPWGGSNHNLVLDTDLEIAIDDDHSILLSAQEAHSSASYSAASWSASGRGNSIWDQIVRQFPAIPGATPIEMTPVTPIIPKGETFDLSPSEAGVQLPAQALEVLQNLNRQPYAKSLTTSSISGCEQEMRERTSPKRTRSFGEKSPASEYSMSQLSIPSPGGFFSSLKAGARHTWCSPSKYASSPPPPSSTTAENFYNVPWNQDVSQTKETIVEYQRDDEVDGPPTVTQFTFQPTTTIKRTLSHEYEAEYEDSLKKAAETNMDQTSSWLTAQTDFLSSLRETDSMIDSTDSTAVSDMQEAIDADSQSALRFLEQAKASTSDEAQVAADSPKVATFLQAFDHQEAKGMRSDVFLHGSSRLDSVSANRVALPKQHVRSLLNAHTSQTLETEHVRPKYRGPFSQNPRNTADFAGVAEQSQLYTVEREQSALNAIKPNVWALEAQRTIMYNGRLLANSAAAERIAEKKHPRVLDLAGAATASWAWAAAAAWPNAKIFTVQTEQQANLAHDDDSAKPETPRNHKVLSVANMWDLPFRDNYFDVISARTLHMYLRAQGADAADEWDLTLKECMRVLKPNGVIDFFVMDSGISNGSAPANATVNLSPINMTAANATQTLDYKRKDIVTEFTSELARQGYEVDGGCGRLMGRLKQEGFVGIKRQWIGLPIGCSEEVSYSSGAQPLSARKQMFRAAPRPISETSLVSRLIDQYAGVEAVQGPVGSTYDVSNVSALLGELLWEEWLVRLRIDSGRYNTETALEGINEQFDEWRRSGKAAWRGVIGWARKPSNKTAPAVAETTTCEMVVEQSAGFRHSFSIQTPVYTASMEAATCYSAPVGIQRRASVRRSSRISARSVRTARSALTIDTNVDSFISRRTGVSDWASQVNEVSYEDYTLSAVDRGEVGEIPMMIIG